MIPRRRRVVVALLALLAVAACGGDGGSGASSRRGRGVADAERERSREDSADASDSASAADQVDDGRPVVYFLGTSLTAGLGVAPRQAYPARIQEKLDSAGLAWRAVNGGVSGETSAGALRRLEWVLRPEVRVLVIETGANDGLRGLDVDSTRGNIEAIISGARSQVPGVRVVLAGMEAPPNLGAAYTARFRALYRDVARRERLPLIPFLLDGVGGVDSLNQSDGIHPTPAGHRIVAANVWRVLEPVLRADR